MTRPPDLPPSDQKPGIEPGWMVLSFNGQVFAVKGSSFEGVYLTAEAATTQLMEPPTCIEVHGGRPRFIVPGGRVFGFLPSHAEEENPVWTVSLRHPEGVAVHVNAIEGPYRGVVLNNTLKTQQGSWPVIELLSM